MVRSRGLKVYNMFKKTTSILLNLLLIILLSGCAIIPDVKPAPALNSVDSYATKTSFSSAKQGVWPSKQWWEAYGDPQLTRLIEEGLSSSPNLAVAEARIKLAEAFQQQTGSALFPRIGVEGSYEKLRQSYNVGIPVPQGVNDMAGATLDMSFQLDFWGKNRSLFAAVTTEAEAARLEMEQTRLVVSTAIASVYADLAQLYANLDAANDASNVRSNSARLIKERQTNGLENEGSYEQEVAAGASTKAEIEALKEAIALTKNGLAALVGAGPDRALEIARPDMQKLKPFGLPDNLPAELIGRRPDIVAARLRAEASSKKIDAAEASFYPNINLVGYAGHQALGLGNFSSPHSLIASVGPTISLPILDGGSLQSQYKQARAGYDASVAVYDDTLLHALHEVANVVTSEEMLAPRLQTTEDAVRASEKAYAVINERYKGGLAAYLSVLRSEDALIASRRALADLRTRSFTLDVALVRALGGGFTPEQQLQK